MPAARWAAIHVRTTIRRTGHPGNRRQRRDWQQFTATHPDIRCVDNAPTRVQRRARRRYLRRITR